MLNVQRYSSTVKPGESTGVRNAVIPSPSPGSPLVAKANLDRLIRSLRKWRDLHSLPYSAEDEEYLRLKSVE